MLFFDIFVHGEIILSIRTKKTRAKISLDSRLYFVGTGSFTPVGVQDDTSDYRLINPSVSLDMAS